ncbi:ubiquitin-conjugating enzyme/RWD-like protein [Pyronema domesticum]|uniref:Ubiquitin-conjugating enzyme E2 2 n=1 Tax=Pyronema omphalodes (strain CBS 100304) TaxID=1076935 RepID=U4LPE9_PYROM|nr:ubiquitin-conjugating enzyme/RWD-like protein [Pyronema domesticum]CCX33800.1 Similar to Ubiquitin-conjugating enzyme E2 pex4; acc. no. Q86IZ3 [Pyronema omphalodes CBS 100304]
MSSSQSPASRRLLQELKKHDSSVSAQYMEELGPVSDDDILHWSCILLGPQGTAYEGCRWKIDIQIPETYPQQPPVLTFKTPVLHPNVHDKTGEICLDLLRGTAWSPLYTIEKTVEAVSHLLSEPEITSPLNVDAANVLRAGDQVGYESLVRIWGVMFAGKPPTLGRF